MTEDSKLQVGLVVTSYAVNHPIGIVLSRYGTSVAAKYQQPLIGLSLDYSGVSLAQRPKG